MSDGQTDLANTVTRTVYYRKIKNGTLPKNWDRQILKSGDLGPTGLVGGQSGWEAQNRENPTRSGDITCMTETECYPCRKFYKILTQLLFW